MVELVPMTHAEFARYLAKAIPSYAEAHRKAGDCDADEALELSKAEYEKLLPLGLDSPNQYLFTVRAKEAAASVGLIWFESRDKRGRKSAYIFDFEIDEAFRGKGYGTQTLRAL